MATKVGGVVASVKASATERIAFAEMASTIEGGVNRMNALA